MDHILQEFDEVIGNTISENVITHPLLQGKPFILETPNEDDGYAKEIAWVKSVMN